ncbi:aminotransferase class V-fold PLP-dependent enzyme [Paracoccaceae bacterium]|nr:aminotransferase class V-fold PLP-dependent enzyme [Paracoccaceae bacterium]
MTLLQNGRRYFDWNASSLLCEKSRDSLISNLDLIGNASSVHLEGREAKNIIEKSRDDIMELLGLDCGTIIFTSGASESAALFLHNKKMDCAAIEHDCVKKWCNVSLPTTKNGQVLTNDSKNNLALQIANSETGILQNMPKGIACTDAVQAVGKIDCKFDELQPEALFLASHKVCGPKGVGVLFVKDEDLIQPTVIGGNQEFGLRAGTENFVLIAAFSEALDYSINLVKKGVWQEIEVLRNLLENEVREISKNTVVVGEEENRLPNTSCIITPGWKGESQVIGLDLEGFSVSSGTACSSGKISELSVLKEMEYDEDLTHSSIRVSLGPNTKKSDIEAFIFSWKQLYLTHTRIGNLYK